MVRTSDNDPGWKYDYMSFVGQPYHKKNSSPSSSSSSARVVKNIPPVMNHSPPLNNSDSNLLQKDKQNWLYSDNGCTLPFFVNAMRASDFAVSSFHRMPMGHFRRLTTKLPLFSDFSHSVASSMTTVMDTELYGY